MINKAFISGFKNISIHFFKMQSLNVFLLHSPRLKIRENCVQTTCKILEAMCQQLKIKCRIFKISHHEANELKNRAEELEKIIKYDKTGDEEYDNLIRPLNMEQMSNIFKQKEALKQIIQLSKLPTITDKDGFLILEDDAYILQEFQNNLLILLQTFDSTPWDVLMLSISAPRTNTQNMEYLNVNDSVKVLPGKEAYMIRPKAAESLLNDFESIRFTYRYQLSYWIRQHPEFNVKYPSLRSFIEGSKVGFVPSSTSENNLLMYNQEFMEIFRMIVGQDPYDFQKIKQLYRVIEHLKSPDAMHLYAVVLHRENKLPQARDMFMDAINEMIAKDGLINARSELLNNTVNIYGLYQDDLEELISKPSKYKKVNFT